MVKEPLPKDDDKEGTKTKQLINHYSDILVGEVNSLRPNLIVPLDELSFNFFTNLNGIRKFRGSVLPLSGNFQVINPNTKVLPILGPHPYLNQEYRLRVISRIDFSKIALYAEDTPLPDKQYNIWVARSSTALRAFIERNYQKTLANPQGVLTFDIETFFQIPICISFCFDGYESVCVPLVDSSVDRDNRVLMMELVAKLLASPVRKVNQNIKYDWKIMERWNFKVNNIVGDTMLAASCLYCEFPKNLGFLTSIYTALPYFKDEGKAFDPDKGKRDRYYLYNAKDSLATSQIHVQQQKEVDELGVRLVHDNLIRVMPIYRKMEDRGIRIDEQARTKLLSKYESLFHIQELKCRQLLNRDYFNALSPKQCVEAIFTELGYNVVQGMKKTQSGGPSTDEESLETLLVKGRAARAPSTGPQVLAAIIAARKVHKVIEVLELPLYPDKRFRCEFNLAGTENGRTSAGETTDQLIYMEDHKIQVTNLGHSLQTIGKHGFMIDGVTYGKDLRSMYVPSPGYMFVENDLSGAEARVDRVLSGVFDMAVFANPGIHKLTGSWLYNCTPSEILKGVLINGVDRYHMAKTVRHAGERNMTADRMVMMTQRPKKECEDILNIFHKSEPKIREVFHKDVINALNAPTHCLVAPNGRRRDFWDRIDKHTYNEAISVLPQMIVSDQTKFHGILKTFENCSIYEYANLLVEAHDGALMEVRKDRAMEIALKYKENIESEPIDFRRGTLRRDYLLTIPCEISVGENWYDMREVGE